MNIICCNKCLKQFKSNHSNRKFCSRSCSASFNNKNKQNNKPKERICRYCNNTYYNSASLNHYKKYCCLNCQPNIDNLVKDNYNLLKVKNLKSYLSNEKKITSYQLKHKLYDFGLLEQKCYICNITNWNGKPAPLELHHIDGNRYNNNLCNLTILCYTCHNLTDTYTYKNKNRYKN